MWPEIRRAQNDNGFWCGLNFAALRMTIVFDWLNFAALTSSGV
jgi:hypothetical protein